jgi:hypothetical protein
MNDQQRSPQPPTAQSIVTLLEQTNLTFVHEHELQAALAEALAAADVEATREVRLSDGRSRIDLLTTTGVGLEVKIDGSWADVVRQLTRYAKCPEIHELILVTTRVRHHHLPAALEGKPIHLLSLIGAAL